MFNLLANINQKKVVQLLNHERTLAMIFLVVLCSFLILHNMHKPRLLILHSYNTDYTWVTDQDEAMQRVFKHKSSYVIKEHYMDTKNKPYEQYKKRAGREARELIQRWNPDVIIICDDDAQSLVGEQFINDRRKKIIFTGIQARLSDYGYDQARNVAGITENVSLSGIKDTLIELNRNPDVNIKRIYHLSDRSTYSQYVIDDIKAFDWSPFELVNSAEYTTFDAWKQSIREANSKADILLLTNYHTLQKSDQDKSVMKAKDVIEWTKENSTLPGIGAWGFYVEDGGDIAIAVSPYEQGQKAAQMAVNLLEKQRTIKELGVVLNHQYIVYMRQSSMSRFHFKLPDIYESFARATNHYIE